MSPSISKKSETLGQRAYREIRRRIVDGELSPGERLPLRGLAEDLGMSLAPIGEAIRDLGRDGLVEHESGVGARVRKLDVESLRNQHVLRIAVECEAIRHATVLSTDTHLEDLRSLASELDKVIDSGGSPEEVRRLDSEFHLQLAKLSGARSLVDALEANQLVRLLSRGSVLAQHAPKPREQHLKIVEPMLARDIERAVVMLRAHCEQSMDLQLRSAAVGKLV